jgi:uncharacterized protein (DUF427 family)
MAEKLSHRINQALPELRYQPSVKRIRVRLGVTDVVDTTRAVLVWEPMRIVPQWAVPEDDLLVGTEPAPPGPAPDYQPVGFGSDRTPLLDPSVPFAVHTAEGQSVTLAAEGRSGAGFRLDDPDLAGYVSLDFDDFDWLEEDEPIIGHARDPFHRIDIRKSSRQVRIEHDGHVLAESSRPVVLFEATFPFPRFYLPREDVMAELRPGSLETTCAYKGHATHYDVVAGEEVLPDMAWSYEQPLEDAAGVTGLVSFYQERLDLWLDGERVARERTPWSAPRS